MKTAPQATVIQILGVDETQGVVSLPRDLVPVLVARRFASSVSLLIRAHLGAGQLDRTAARPAVARINQYVPVWRPPACRRLPNNAERP
jgi:hypothetical protein